MNSCRTGSGGNTVHQVSGISGLSLLRAAISNERGTTITDGLRDERWARWRHWRPFSRQDFGYAYDIGSRDVGRTVPIPDEIRALFPALREAGWVGPDPTQVIVTRYPQGGSLGTHIDSAVFGPEVAGVSLGTEWPILFSTSKYEPAKPIPLPVLSAYVMRGPARTRWFHRIPPNHDGERISLTFRTLAEASTGTPRTAADRQAGIGWR